MNTGLSNKTEKNIISFAKQMRFFAILFSLSVVLCTSNLYAQYPETLIRKGNSIYFDGDFQGAEKNYRKALQKDTLNHKAMFNLGDALYMQKNYSQAANIFKNLSGQNLDSDIKSKVYHNLGNSLLSTAIYSDTLDFNARQGKVKESIEAYKNSLRLSPDDNDSRYNLVYANKLLKKMQQQQQQQQQNQDKKEEEKDNKEDKQQKEQQQEKNKDEKQQKKESSVSKEDAERMLEALKNNEKKTKENLEKGKKVPVQSNIENDW